MLLPKPPKPWRSERYRRYVASLKCSVPSCYQQGGNAHHEAEGGNKGVGCKPSDSRCYCLCPTHHRIRHDQGRHMLDVWGLDVEAIISATQAEWVRRGGRREWESG